MQPTKTGLRIAKASSRRAARVEDFFRLDQTIAKTLRPQHYLLCAELSGLLTRLVLIGESEQGQTRGCQTVGPADSNLLLTLYYSEFFRLAKNLEPPPGPRPLNQGADSGDSRGLAERLRRHGLLLRTSERFETGGPIEEHWPPAIQAALLAISELPDQNAPTEIGLQFVTAELGERLLFAVRFRGERSTDEVLLDLAGRIGVHGTDYFVRCGRNLRYFPAVGVREGVRPIGFSFRRQEQRRLKDSYAMASIPLATNV